MKIRNYNLYLYSHKNGESDWIPREQGQRLIMALSQPNPPKFILIDNDLINTTNISKVEEEVVKRDLSEERELDSSEVKTQKLFDKLKNKTLLLN